MSNSLIQRSLAGGELAPALWAHADNVKYQTGLKACRNFRIQKHGGAANRTGSRFIAEVKTSSAKTYMLPFVFNDDQTYVIEAGNLYFRFIRAGARITVSGVAAWSAVVNYVVGDLASRLGVNYYCILAHINQQPPNATYWYPLTGDIYEIPTPYVTADLETLEIVQSGDVVTITHPNYDPRELTRTAHTTWILTTETFAPSIAAPTGVTNSGAAGSTTEWVVTAVKQETYEESLQSSSTGSSAVPSGGSPITVSWNAVSGAQEYNVYKKTNGIWGFIGIAGGLSFIDNGITPNTGFSPPISRNPFSGASNKPSTVSYYQQRLVFANTDNDIEKVWTSRSGMFNNFTISSPLQDDDAVTFSVAGRKVNEVRHLVDIGILIILTASGEWIVEGDADGVLRANQPPNLRQIGYNGSSQVWPIIIDSNIVYVQSRGSIVRDLRYEVSSQSSLGSYKGRDLTVFASHLFTNKRLTRMTYAQAPDSIAYATRSDGILLGLTYLPEHEIWGWHRHDTLGSYEDVLAVPEGNEDAVYVMVRRTINGQTKRYIERFASRDFTDISVDAIFMDSYLSYDGRNWSVSADKVVTFLTGISLSLSTAGGWTIDDVITVTATSALFSAGDVGNDFVLHVLDNDPFSETYLQSIESIAIRVTGFTSNTVVTGTPSKTVPTAFRSSGYLSWARAVDEIGGLGHLEGEDLSVFADGNVVSNPNNAAYQTITVAAGVATLDRPYSVIHAGLPFISDLRTLDLDIHGSQVRMAKQNVTHIGMFVESSRGIFVGPDESHLREVEPEPITDYGQPWPSMTKLIVVPIAATWDESGSVLVRQVDPLPLKIVMLAPTGWSGGT